MKKVFFYTDVLGFLSREDKAIDKLNRNLTIFKEATDEIYLVWHPWSGTKKYLVINKSAIVDEYIDIVETYRNDNWGVLDESDSFTSSKEVMLSCDAYYGDICDLVYEAQNANIPVMIQSIDV